MIKLLGILDIFSALVFLLSHIFSLNISTLLILISLYLIIKGAIFLISKDVASVLDIISGFIILASIQFTLNFIIVTILSIYLLQKGVLSLI